MLKNVLLGFGVLSNVATLVGLWVGFISLPETKQAAISHGLLIAGAISSIILYFGIAYLIFRKGPASDSSEKKAEDQKPERSYFEKLADEDSAEMSKRVILCGISTKFQANTVEP